MKMREDKNMGEEDEFEEDDVELDALEDLEED